MFEAEKYRDKIVELYGKYVKATGDKNPAIIVSEHVWGILAQAMKEKLKATTIDAIYINECPIFESKIINKEEIYVVPTSVHKKGFPEGKEFIH